MHAKVGNLESAMQLSKLTDAAAQNESAMKEKSTDNTEKEAAINGTNNQSGTEGCTTDEKSIIDEEQLKTSDGGNNEENGACNEAYVPDNQESKEQPSYFRENMKACHERLKPVKTSLPDFQATSDLQSGAASQDTCNIKFKSLTFFQALKALTKQSTLKPLMLVISFFVLHHWTGLSGIRPYMVSVFEDFGLPLDPHWVTVLSAVLGIAGNIFCMATVAWLGKRPLALSSIAGVGCSALMIGTYMCMLQAGIITSSKWLPLTLFIFFFSFHSFGIGPIPWMLLSEVFPFEGRGVATGIAAAVSYVLGFFASESFLDLKRLLGLGGVFILYGCVALVGVVYMGLYLPETEGHTLHDIEAMYSKKNKGDKKRVQVSRESNCNGATVVVEDVASKTAL